MSCRCCEMDHCNCPDYLRSDEGEDAKLITVGVNRFYRAMGHMLVDIDQALVAKHRERAPLPPPAEIEEKLRGEYEAKIERLTNRLMVAEKTAKDRAEALVAEHLNPRVRELTDLFNRISATLSDQPLTSEEILDKIEALKIQADDA